MASMTTIHAHAHVLKDMGPREVLDLLHTSGRPFILMDIRVVVEEDEESLVEGEGSAVDRAGAHAHARDVVVGSGEVGEVWCRGPTVFDGGLFTQSCSHVLSAPNMHNAIDMQSIKAR